MKLLGNSFYGKTLTNKQKHVKFSYVDNAGTNVVMNEPTFRLLNKISPTCFELMASPKNIAEDLPLQIGFFVYQYTKLRMLQFYYGFLYRFMKENYFELAQMDMYTLYFDIGVEN